LPRLEHHGRAQSGFRRRIQALPQGPAVRLRRRHDPVREDQDRAHGERRSAPVAARALHGPRRLRQRGARGGRESGRLRLPPPGGRRRADRGGRRERGTQPLKKQPSSACGYNPHAFFFFGGSCMIRRVVLAALLLACLATAEARVTKIVLNPVADSDPVLSDGAPFPIRRITGRAFGELDPKDPHNAIIQDIRLAPKTTRGRGEYQATFQLILPSDTEKLSGLMWHDVPNRGGRVTIVAAERNAGDVGLSSGWQGDNSGGTSQEFGDREVVVVPVARNPDGSAITGRVLGRIVNRSGPDSEPILVQSSPLPYRPAAFDTKKATLTAHSHETTDGKVTVHTVIASRDWAWARCDAQHPFPGTPDATQICLRKGFDEK